MHSLVYMNHGRWVVDCPNSECTWSYLAMTPDHRPRYQHICTGDQTGRGCGSRIEPAWPPLDAALEIERLLYARALPVNRNWTVKETVDGLSAENEAALVGWNLKRLADEGI